MAIRDKAKQGLSRMEEMGQMGNADQVNNPDQTFAKEDGEYEDDDFEGNIDSIMAEDGGEEVKMAAGGYMTGTDLSKAPKNSAIDVRYFKHADGRRIYITYINNRPMTVIPEGFTETDDIVEKQVGKAAEEKEAAKTASTDDAKQTSGGESPYGGNSTTPTGSTSVSSPFGANPNTGLATPMGKGAKGIAAVAGTVLGIPALAALGIKGYDAAINAANNNALSSSLGANGFTTAAIQAAQEAAANEGTNSSSTPTSIAEAASNAAAGAQKGMTSLDAFIAINQNTFPASQFDPMADTPAASQSNAPAPGTEGPPAPTASTVASGQGGDSGGDSGGGKGTYICTASYNLSMITPTHFKSLKQYGIGLRKNDQYLMRAYDSFGPKLASYVGKSVIVDKAAKFLTDYYKAVQIGDTLATKQKAFSYVSDYILRPTYRIIGWVLIKIVDKK